MKRALAVIAVLVLAAGAVVGASVVQTDTDAADGATYTVDLSEEDSLKNATVTFTGAENTEDENVTPSSSVTNGTVSQVNVSGNAAPTGPSNNSTAVVTVMGVENTYNPVEDEGDGGNDASVLLAGDDGSDNAVNSSIELLNPPTYFDTIIINKSGTTGSEYPFTVDVWAGQDSIDTDYGPGDADTTQVADNVTLDFSSGQETINLSTEFYTNDTNVTIEFLTNTSDTDATEDSIDLHTDTSAGAGNSYTSHGSTLVDSYGNATVLTPDPLGVGIDYDDDGTSEDTLGDLPLDTNTDYEIANLSTGENVTWLSSNNGTWTFVELNFTERTVSENVSMLVNGNESNMVDKLGVGVSENVTIPASHLQEGSNTLELNITPTLDSDAPSSVVDFEFINGTAAAGSGGGGVIDTFTSNPILTIAGISVILLLLAGFIWYYRRQNAGTISYE